MFQHKFSKNHIGIFLRENLFLNIKTTIINLVGVKWYIVTMR